MAFRIAPIKIGPVRINLSTKTGVSSVSVKAGPTSIKVLDFQGRKTGLSSVSLPGGVRYQSNEVNRKR